MKPNYKLIKEHPQSYEIHDGNDGRSFHVAKGALNLSMHAKLSKLPHYSDGGDVLASELPASDASFDPNSLPYESDTQRAYSSGENLRHGISEFVGGGEKEKAKEDLLKSQSPDGGGFSSFMNGLVGSPQPSAPSAQPDIQKGPAPAGFVDGTPAAPQSNPLADQAAAQESSLQKYQQAMNQSAGAQVGLANSQANDVSNMQQNMQKEQAAFDKTREEYKQKDDDLTKAFMNKTIDPDRVFKNMSTGDRVLGALGMILGGIGSGLSGQKNFAVEAMNNSIERDIAAQKDDQSKSMNLWKMNREAMGDDMRAHLATESQMWSAVKAKAMMYSAQAQGIQAKTAAAGLNFEIDQKLNDLRFRRSVLSQGQSGGMQSLDPTNLLNSIQDPKQREAAEKEITQAKQLAQASSTAMSVFNRLKEINTIGNRIMNPIQSSRQVAALRDNAAVELARDEAGKVNEFEFIAAQHAFPEAGDQPSTINEKDKNLRAIINKKKVPGTAFQNATGVPLDRFAMTSANSQSGISQQDKQYYDWAVKNPSNPKAQLVLQKLGMR